MKRLLFPLFIIAVLLFCTVRLPAQTAQVSPVSNLQGSNSSVMNSNMQILQSGINGLLYQLSQYFPGGILQGNMGGTGLNSTTVVSGDTLVSSNGIWIASTGLHGYQIFTSSGTFTPPYNGVVFLTMIGAGGGGGGGANNTNDIGAGGGAGGYVINLPYTVTVASADTVTINAGGSGSIGNGATGGTTVFGAVTAPGGIGGLGTGGYTGGAGGGGLTGAGNNYSFMQGGTGATGNLGTGNGGGSPFGIAGAGNNGGVGGNATANSGGGGGGGGGSGSGASGGNGGSGIVIVAY